MSVAIILLDGLIAGVEMGSEIPVQRSELIGLKSIFESELSQLRAENEALKKQVSSYKLLTSSMEETKTYLLKKADQNKEAVDTLASEREANAVLTAENERLKAELAEAKKAAEQREDLQDVVSKALRKAWQLGQTYWQQADSESYSQNKRADDTYAKFQYLVHDTLEAMKGK